MKAIVLIIIMALSFTLYASDQYLSFGVSYTNLMFSDNSHNHCGSLIFSGFNYANNIAFGGYGGLIGSNKIQLGFGGLLIGFRFIFFERLHISVSGKAGLGGGIFHNSPGATYQVGGEFNLGLIKNSGLELSLSYDKIHNLYKIENLEKNGLNTISIGLKYLINVIK